MKVLHVIPTFYPAHIYGGPIQSVYTLCRYLVRGGCDVRVLTTNANGADAVLDVPTDRDVSVEGVSVRYCRRWATENGSLDLLRLLPSAIAAVDLVHLTAVYSFPTVPVLALSKLAGKPVVWSPRGSLQRWQGSTKVRIKTLWECLCRLAAPESLMLHVTSVEECEESTAKIRGACSAVIPNGVEIPAVISREPASAELRLVYLGRLHQKKGIENLLEACHALLKEAPNLRWTLKIAGTGEPAYTELLRRRVKFLGLENHTQFVGEVIGEEKTRFFRDADLLLMPSHTENFGMVVVEALAHGVPTIASTRSPWQGLKDNNCGFWVPNDPSTLTRTIIRAHQSPLSQMGAAGREWMLREFSWEQRAAQTMSLYRALIENRGVRGTITSSASSVC